MKYHLLRFSQIMQTKLLYYDSYEEAACHNICDYLHIDNLPATDGQSYYLRVNSVFKKMPMNDLVQVQVNDEIFGEHVLTKFRASEHNVLFVYEGRCLRGVVHLSDYNADILLQTIQDDILAFERKLRQWYHLNGKANNNLMEYLRVKGERNQKHKTRYENLLKREKEMNELGAFQLFDFRELLLYGASEVSNKLFPSKKIMGTSEYVDSTDELCELRNTAMHAKNPVSQEQYSGIYSIQSLETLISRLRCLELMSAELDFFISQNLDYIRAIELDNRSRLQIIHQHHPKALEFFLGG